MRVSPSGFLTAKTLPKVSSYSLEIEGASCFTLTSCSNFAKTMPKRLSMILRNFRFYELHVARGRRASSSRIPATSHRQVAHVISIDLPIETDILLNPVGKLFRKQ